MEGWKELYVKDLGTVMTGNTPSRAKPEFYGNHTTFIKPTDISKGKKYCYDSEECYSDIGYRKYKKSLIPKGSTCVVTIGSIGEKVILSHDEIFINQAMNAVIPSADFDKNFVYYLLKFNLFQLKTFDSGTASGRENVSKTSFSNIRIRCPESKASQQKIADILSAYDDLIENNLKRIELLEEQAQLTYEEWFVRMKFPNHENTPIDSETGLPEGWEQVKVEKLLSKVESTRKIKKSEVISVGSIPVIDQSRDFIAGYTNEHDAVIEVIEEPLIVFGDHTRILKLVNFNFARGADGTQLIASNSERMPQHLFYFSLKNIDLSDYHYARHFKYLKSSEIILPDLVTAQYFEITVSQYYKTIQNLRSQNQLLKEARDILLPRLMTGMIEV